MPTRAKASKPAAPAVDFDGAFTTLKSAFAKHQRKFDVTEDTANALTLVSKSPSPFKQHKGRPLPFGAVQRGKAYVSFHLVPLYMHPPLRKLVSPELKKRMQGLACFNFKAPPERALLGELNRLVAASVKDWASKGWL